MSVNCLIDLASAFLPERLGLGVWCSHPSLQNEAEGVFCRLWHCAVSSPSCLCEDRDLWKQVRKCQRVDSGLSLVSWDWSAKGELASASLPLRGSWVRRSLGSLLDLAFLTPFAPVCWLCPLNGRLVLISPCLCPLARDSNLVPQSDTPYVWTASPSHTLNVRLQGTECCYGFRWMPHSHGRWIRTKTTRDPPALPSIFALNVPLPTMGSEPQSSL